MSGRVDLKTHMNKSSIKELIKYIEAAGMTPPTCNDIYTIARGIQYMDDTYLRENTTEKLRSLKADKSKTPVPYNEWVKCMFKPTEETRISDINGLSCETKKCRKSEGLGSCLPKSRMLKDPLSKKDINDLKILSTAIMEKKIDEINKKNLSPYEKRVMEHSIKLGFDVFDDRFRVPLLFTGFGVKSGIIINQQVRTIDIFPTICNIIKISDEIDADGKDILPIINGEHMEEMPAYLESMANWTEEREAKISDVIGIRYKNNFF